jgi:hypothetical protein
MSPQFSNWGLRNLRSGREAPKASRIVAPARSLDATSYGAPRGDFARHDELSRCARSLQENLITSVMKGRVAVSFRVRVAQL